jgi:peptide/nickel transport system substrate-binding protein
VRSFAVRLRAIALLVALAFWIPACRRLGPDTRTLRIVMAPEVHGLDPHRQTAHGGQSLLSNVYEGLTAFDEEMRVVPALAASWESPDELTWRFHLRSRVLFHDGRPLTATAVVRSIARARMPQRSAQGGLASVASVTAPAADIVEIRTTRPSPMLLDSLTTAFIVPDDAPDPIASPIGTGPYRFASENGESIELVAWSRHWRGAPAVSRLSFSFEAEPDRRQQRLARGAADVALRLSETATEPPRSGYRVLWRSAPGTRVIGLRVDRAPFSDQRVRQAVNLAIDREALARTLLAGRALPVGQVVPRVISGYVPQIAAPSRDLEQARRLLRGAAPRGLAVTLEHGRGRLAEADAIAAQLAEAGFRVTLHARDVPDLIPSLDRAQANMVLFSYVHSSGDEEFLSTVLHRRDPDRGYGAANPFGYANPEVDALIEGTEGASVPERLTGYQKALRLVSADLPVVPLWEVAWVYGVRDSVEWSPVAHGWFEGARARWR